MQRHASFPKRASGWVAADRWRGARSEAGSTLLLSLLILSAMTILASSVVVTAMGERNLTKYERHSLIALAAAESGIAYAKRAIVEQTADMADIDEDGRPDFALSDSLPDGGSYSVVAEASDIKGLGITAYQANGFAIVSEGEFQGAVRRVKVEIVHDSFLKFARFVSSTDLSYACYAALTGEVYTGGDLDVPCGCGSDEEAKFLESAYAVEDIPNADCATFYMGYVTQAEEIDLENSFDWNDTRNKAKGLAPDNACEKKGSVGIYINLGGSPIKDPLGLHTQPAPNTDVLIFDYFDFMDMTLAAPDTVITYNGVAVTNTVTMAPMRRSEFNGIIFFEGQANSRGTMDGVSAHNVTIFATTTNIVRGDIVTGHLGFDEVTRNPNGVGNPVNVGLVAENYVGMHAQTKKVLRVDAALLSRTSNWTALGDTGTHPNATGPLDLDLDGITGESPVNHDPIPGIGWNESVIDANTWVLNINGPIITNTGGSAGPWSSGSVIANADGPTRRYNYDLDVTEFPPPCFPVPLNLWKDVSWTEVFDVRSDLSSNLPN